MVHAREAALAAADAHDGDDDSDDETGGLPSYDNLAEQLESRGSSLSSASNPALTVKAAPTYYELPPAAPGDAPKLVTMTEIQTMFLSVDSEDKLKAATALR